MKKLRKQAIVMRRAVLMEDEGLEHFIKSFPSLAEAKKWIADQAGEYFSPSDCYTLEAERE